METSPPPSPNPGRPLPKPSQKSGSGGKLAAIVIVLGGVAAAVYFYDPFLKPYLGPVVESVTGKSAPAASAAPAPKTDASPPPAKTATAAPAAPTKNAGSSPAPVPAAAPAAPKSEIDRLVEERYPIPKLHPLLEIVKNWTAVPANAFPNLVAIKVPLPFILRGPDGNKIGESVLQPGTEFKPLSLNGSTLTIANPANPAAQNQIDIDQTDFKERVQKRYQDFESTMTQRILDQRARAKKAMLEKPETLAAVKAGAFKPGPNEDPRLVPVKSALHGGMVKSFTLEEAIAFRWNGSERVNGDKFRGVYDTVTVRYEAKTIFGTFPGEAKCLLQVGRVVGWIDPITEDELL